MKLTPESNAKATQMFTDFVMHSGKVAEALHKESGDRMGREAFLQYSAKVYGKLTVISTDANGNETSEQMDAGKFFWDCNSQMKRVVRRVVLDPGAPFDPDIFNRWEILKQSMCQPNMNATPADIGIFIRHLMFISDDDAVGVAYFLNWLASLYKHPEIKVPSAIMLFSRRSRMGKSILHKILAPVFGAPMVGNCAGHELHKNFMDAIEDKRLIILNELSRSDKQDSYERFKNMISEPDLQFEGKGRASKNIRNIAHFILTTNHDDALPLMEKDGRILVLRCEAARRPDAYYRGLAEWMEGPGPSLLAGVLAQWQFPKDWDPYAPVPQTEACVRTQQESRPGLEGFIAELMASHAAPFDKDFGKIASLVEEMHTLYPGNCRGFKVNNIWMARALQGLGAERVKVQWQRANTMWTSAVPYVWRNADRWITLAPDKQSMVASQEMTDYFTANYK